MEEFLKNKPLHVKGTYNQVGKGITVTPDYLIPDTIEHELVLASISLDPKKNERILELLKEEVDWELLFRITIQHGVFPLVYCRLKAIQESLIPAKVINLWNEAFQENSRNNLRLTWKMIQFVDLISGSGFDCVILKGPAITLQAYGELALRPFSDLDILIHPKDFAAVYDLLVQTGYSPDFKLSEKRKKYQEKSENHFPFNRQGNVIEVHWGIAPKANRFPINSQQLWQNLAQLEILDKKFNTLSLENTILFTCMHGAKHAWGQLKWVTDLAFLCQKHSNFDWNGFLQSAKKIGFFRQICLGLILAEKLGGLILSAQIHQTIHSDRKAQLLASQVISRLFKKVEDSGSFGDYGFYLKSRERLADHLYYLFDIFFVPKQIDWLTFSLPEPLYFFYYILRPLRLLTIIGRAYLFRKA